MSSWLKCAVTNAQWDGHAYFRYTKSHLVLSKMVGQAHPRRLREFRIGGAKPNLKIAFGVVEDSFQRLVCECVSGARCVCGSVFAARRVCAGVSGALGVRWCVPPALGVW